MSKETFMELGRWKSKQNSIQAVHQCQYSDHAPDIYTRQKRNAQVRFSR